MEYNTSTYVIMLIANTITANLKAHLLCPSFLHYTQTYTYMYTFHSQKHINVCVYRTVNCPHKGCEMVLPFNQLASHRQACQFKRVACEYCKTETAISQQEVRKLLLYQCVLVQLLSNDCCGHSVVFGRVLVARFPPEC